MNVRIALALLLVTALAAPVAARTPAAKAGNPLGMVVRALLAQAPGNFAALRLAKDDYDTDFTRYKARPLGAYCKGCKIYDQYARGTYKENWYVEDRWNVPDSWGPAKIESSVMQQLRPVLSGFVLHRTVPKYSKYPALLWRGPHNLWVDVKTYEGEYTMRVGHDLTKPVHVLLAPTQAQRKQLTDGLSNIIRLGAPGASTNFENLRSGAGTKNDFGDEDYGTNVSFGPMFRKCRISQVTNGFGYQDFQPKWVLSCDTVAMAGTAAALKETVRASVSDALPDGFSATTDNSALLLDDYRWDDSDVSVDISSTQNDGSMRFTISIYHYLPKGSGGS